MWIFFIILEYPGFLKSVGKLEREEEERRSQKKLATALRRMKEKEDLLMEEAGRRFNRENFSLKNHLSFGLRFSTLQKCLKMWSLERCLKIKKEIEVVFQAKLFLLNRSPAG